MTSCAEDDDGNPQDERAGVLDVVDRESGAVRVSVPIPANHQWAPAVDSSTIAIWDDRGHMVERDTSTGAIVASGTIPALADDGGGSDVSPSVVIREDAWVVLDPPSMMIGDTDVIIGTYRRPTLEPLWTVKLPGSVADVRQFYGLWQCEPAVLCVQLSENEQIRLDAATGARLPDRQAQGQRIGGHWSAIVERAAVAGEVVVLRDDRIGRIVFPSWRVANVAREDPAMVTLVRLVGHVTEFAIFDGHAGRLRALGGAPGAFAGCELTGRRLFCVDDHLVLHVWPVGS